MTRTARKFHLSATAERRTLMRELATYNSPADRAELDAMLDRYDADTAAPIRDIVDQLRARAA